MKRFLTSVLLTAGASLALHLYQKKQTPLSFAREVVNNVQTKKQALTEVEHQQAAVRHRLVAFQRELAKAQPVIDDLTKSVDQFQFKIQPHLDKLSDRLENVGKTHAND
ncbi:hypothetical protein [Secundilactobacillus folii]|uniref:Uncharacterized protein n=1 Tax=Secundilactobacillus folii TaxID=2678357 RepID=A0A7X2XVX4_9LACO|nr:hypothetical protein [Secundilactobacillus folii]MTV82614.1 hypothetical protein [Secundilactobacillus folii]